MRLLSWLSRRIVTDNQNGRNRKHQLRLRIRPRLEILEDRCLPSTFTVLNTSDHDVDSLRADIALAQSGDTINFDHSLNGQTITLTSGELVINKDLDIEGPGAAQLTISSNHFTQVFEILVDTVSLAGLTIANGQADFGGGILNEGTLTLTNSTLSGNTASSFIGGGGIFNLGTVTVTNSTFCGNSADLSGGGILNGGTLTVTNSTFSGNSATVGGGILNEGTLTLTNSTLSGNSAGEGGGGIASNGTLTLANTIIAGNTAPLSGPDVDGSVHSLGHNLIGNADGSSGFGAAGDQVGTGSSPIDPLLGPLQDNGGPTETMALLPGSPALDAGSNDLAVDSFGIPLLYDQRGPGFVRISGAFVDIGAFEQQQSPPAVTVDGPTTDPEGTAVTFSGSFTGGGTASGPYKFTWHVTADNGQTISDQMGTVFTPGNVSSFIFTPADEGAYNVTLTVTDKFNLAGAQSAALTATNVAPTATITGVSQPHPLFILAGDSLKFSGSFSDPGTLDGHTVTWNFGDGNSTTGSFGSGGSASFSAKHAFAAPGTYVVTLTVMDDDDAVGTAQMTVVVQTPAGATGSLLAYVQTLTGLNAGQQNSLLSTLNAVIASLNRGDTTSAKNQLGAFENKVKAFFQAGLLTGAQESFLLSSADAIQQEIG